MYIYIESTNKECCFKKLHLFGNKKCMLWAKFKLTISQPACTASGHVSRVTRMPRDMSQNLGHGERLEDVICPLQTRPREFQVHLQTGVVQAGGPQPPVDHVNLKIQTTIKIAEPKSLLHYLEHLCDVASLPLLESGDGAVGLGDVQHSQDDEAGSDAGPHQQGQHQRHLRLEAGIK